MSYDDLKAAIRAQGNSVVPFVSILICASAERPVSLRWRYLNQKEEKEEEDGVGMAIVTETIEPPEPDQAHSKQKWSV